MRIAAALIVTLIGFVQGCSTHFSTLKGEGQSKETIYTIGEERAFQIAHATLATTLPGRKIEVIDGPVRGYSTYTRFVLDTYTQQVLVHAARGTEESGKVVRGYYFEVSGSGSSGSGRAKNVELFEKIAEAAKATGKGVSVSAVERVGYSNAKWRAGEGPSVSAKEDALSSLERLKEFRDRGVISEQEFETKKKELLDRL